MNKVPEYVQWNLPEGAAGASRQGFCGGRRLFSRREGSRFRQKRAYVDRFERRLFARWSDARYGAWGRRDSLLGRRHRRAHEMLAPGISAMSTAFRFRRTTERSPPPATMKRYAYGASKPARFKRRSTGISIGRCRSTFRRTEKPLPAPATTERFASGTYRTGDAKLS